MNKAATKIYNRIEILADEILANDGIEIALYKFSASMRRDPVRKDNLLKLAVYSKVLEKYFDKYNSKIKDLISLKYPSSSYAQNLANMSTIITKDSYLNLLPTNMTSREKQVIDSCSIYVKDGLIYSKCGAERYGNIRTIGLTNNPHIDSFTIHGLIFLCTTSSEGDYNAELRESHGELYVIAKKDIQPHEKIILSRESIIKQCKSIPIEVLAYIKDESTNTKDILDSAIDNVPIYKINRLRKESKTNKLMIRIASYVRIMSLNGVDKNSLLYEATDYVPLEKDPKDEDILNALVKTVYKYYIYDKLNYNTDIAAIVTGTMNLRDFISFLFNNIDKALELIDSDEFVELINKEHHTKSLVTIDDNNLAAKVDILKGTYIVRCNSTFSSTKQHRWDLRFLFVKLSTNPNSKIEEYIADKPHPFELRVITTREISKGEPITISYSDFERFGKLLDEYSIFDAIPYVMRVSQI